jgi:hypothetical protein
MLHAYPIDVDGTRLRLLGQGAWEDETAKPPCFPVAAVPKCFLGYGIGYMSAFYMSVLSRLGV